MFSLNGHRVSYPASLFLLMLSVTNGSAQLVWNQRVDKYSAILPLTLDNNVYRIRAKPPEGIKPADINCDIGITGTVLTDQRGTSAGDAGEKVVGGLQRNDNIDVYFSDRVYTDNRDIVGNRIVEKYDFDCGVNIKYQNLLKVAQVEIRVGYVLPTGDREGLTWAKLARKTRLYVDNLNKCAQYRRDLSRLEGERSTLMSTSTDNYVYQMRAKARLNGISSEINRKSNFVAKEDAFRRDLAAFISLEEYLKTKVHGCQVYVHFHHNGKTLPVDIGDLKRSRVRPIQVFEYEKDPIIKANES